MKGLLVDTNLLIVYVIGLSNPKNIETHNRTKGNYTEDDWDGLHQFLSNFQQIYTTLSVLTEASNLLPYKVSGSHRQTLFTDFSKVIADFQEENVLAANCVGDNEFSRLGLTDIGIEGVAKRFAPNLDVLTDDLDLYILLSGRGVTVHNFNQIRGKRMGI